MKRLFLYYILLVMPKVFLGMYNNKIWSSKNLEVNHSDPILSNSSIQSGLTGHYLGDNKAVENFHYYFKFKSQTSKDTFGDKSSNMPIRNATNLVNNTMDAGENETAQNFERIQIGGRKIAGDDENKHVKTLDTLDDQYYDWGFGFGNIAPGLGIQDAKGEGVVTTDISCWDCDEEHGEANLYVRCDYTLIYNGTLAPKGFACMRFQVFTNESSGKAKIYNKARCVNAPSSFFDPCEEVVRSTLNPKRVQNCKICYNDGCNPACFDKNFSLVFFLVIMAILLMCCCLVVCLACGSRLFCFHKCR